MSGFWGATGANGHHMIETSPPPPPDRRWGRTQVVVQLLYASTSQSEWPYPVPRAVPLIRR